MAVEKESAQVAVKKESAQDGLYLEAQNSPADAFDRYVEALQGHRTELYNSRLLTENSRAMFHSRTPQGGAMQAEYQSLNKPYQIKEMGRYAVVLFDEKEVSSSPYFIENTFEGWQIDLNTMSQAIRFSTNNAWHLVPGIEHSYLFAF